MDQATKAKPGQYLTFNLNSRPYGVPIASVREINRLSDIAPVPHTPEFVAGVMNLRGKVIPVISLRRKFGFRDADHTKHTCIIVIEGVDGQVGIIVDSVSGVIDLAAEQIEPAPVMGEPERLDFIIGMGKTDNVVVILVDAVMALSRDNLATVLHMPQAAA
jgi:purine-binding chemotaxis protein CheW